MSTSDELPTAASESSNNLQNEETEGGDILPNEKLETESSQNETSELEGLAKNEETESVDILPNEKLETKNSQTETTNDQTSKRRKVAIIGSGIGGASTAHFLRKHYGDSIHIDVFEKTDRMGGRLLSAHLNGESFETGGTIIHSSNKYMAEFTKEMGLETNQEKAIEKFGIWNGNEFLFTETSMNWWNTVKMVFRYGPLSLKRLNDVTTSGANIFPSIYEKQDAGQTFKTVPDLLTSIGGEYFTDCTQKTWREVLKEKGVGDKLIDEFVNSILRMIYYQTADELNGLTGLFSLLGGDGSSLWNVKGGNEQVPQRLIEESKSTVHYNCKITSIKKLVNESSGKATYELESDASTFQSNQYDAVIVSVPLEDPRCFISCPEIKNWPQSTDLGQFQRCVSSIIQQPINAQYFGVKAASKLPDAITTTCEKAAADFGFIEINKTVHGNRCDPPTYRVFSREPLTEDSLRKLFIMEENTAPQLSSVDWLAYPHYSPPERFLPFELDEGVFYVNAIERAASGMEMSAIGGRNAALLAVNYLENRN
ncbi:prenylcysteine oxidase 1-like [Clytia hemisphaerica]|uniref:Prenylcysteine lyase domain-containing protein n=1 Tax=Clytia hemisphaerica TaxID=252671 RepID=A0A7M5VF88_9CNID